MVLDGGMGWGLDPALDARSPIGLVPYVLTLIRWCISFTPTLSLGISAYDPEIYYSAEDQRLAPVGRASPPTRGLTKN
jgi:hypothetical protein